MRSVTLNPQYALIISTKLVPQFNTFDPYSSQDGNYDNNATNKSNATTMQQKDVYIYRSHQQVRLKRHSLNLTNILREHVDVLLTSQACKLIS